MLRIVYHQSGAPFNSARLPESKYDMVRRMQERSCTSWAGSDGFDGAIQTVGTAAVRTEVEERTYNLGGTRTLWGKRFPGPAPRFTDNKLPCVAVV